MTDDVNIRSECGQAICTCPCPDCGQVNACPNHCPALHAHADYLRREGYDPDDYLQDCDGSLYEAVCMACVAEQMTEEDWQDLFGTNKPQRPADPGAEEHQ